MTTPNRKPNSTDNDAVRKAKTTAASASNKVKTAAEDIADTVTTEAAGYAEQAKGAAADEVKGVASALRTAANELRSGSPQERTFGQIADGLADASESMRDRDMGEIVGDLNNFARRNPMLFLGSAALIGLAATRFAKASGSSSTRNPVPNRTGQTAPDASTAPAQSVHDFANSTSTTGQKT